MVVSPRMEAGAICKGSRGFTQDELVKLGKRRGVLAVGLVWGLWHFPAILSGVHTYPPTSLGLGLGLVFFVLWSFVQSYAVLKAKSIWVATFLHGVVNSVYGFMLRYVVHPDDKVVSFGLGIYGLACLAVVVLFILRDPIWGQVKSRDEPWPRGGDELVRAHLQREHAQQVAGADPPIGYCFDTGLDSVLCLQLPGISFHPIVQPRSRVVSKSKEDKS